MAGPLVSQVVVGEVEADQPAVGGFRGAQGAAQAVGVHVDQLAETQGQMVQLALAVHQQRHVGLLQRVVVQRQRRQATASAHDVAKEMKHEHGKRAIVQLRWGCKSSEA